MTSKFLWILIVIVSVLIVTSVTTSGKNVTPSATPDFTLPDLTGKDISLSNYLGNKIILLVFGATTCVYCRNQVPELKEIYEKFKKKDFVLLYIHVDESERRVKAFVKKNKIPYTVLLDEKGEAAYSYRVYGFPWIFLINRKGEVAFTYAGPTHREFLSGKIEELLR